MHNCPSCRMLNYPAILQNAAINTESLLNVHKTQTRCSHIRWCYGSPRNSTLSLGIKDGQKVGERSWSECQWGRALGGRIGRYFHLHAVLLISGPTPVTSKGEERLQSFLIHTLISSTLNTVLAVTRCVSTCFSTKGTWGSNIIQVLLLSKHWHKNKIFLFFFPGRRF